MFLPPDLKGKMDYFELCPDLRNRIDLNLSTQGVSGSDRGYDTHVSLSHPVVAPLRLIRGRFVPPLSPPTLCVNGAEPYFTCPSVYLGPLC